MNLNSSDISGFDAGYAGKAGHTGGNINRMEPFSSFCFGTNSVVPRSAPRDIPGAEKTTDPRMQQALVHVRQGAENDPVPGRFYIRDSDDAQQVASLLKTTLGIADGLACTEDRKRFLVQYQGAIFNFCLNDNNEITASSCVHPPMSRQRDFASVAGGRAPVFRKMEGARQLLHNYLMETNKAGAYRTYVSNANAGEALPSFSSTFSPPLISLSRSRRPYAPWANFKRLFKPVLYMHWRG
ncbi:hypothetical protein ABK905_08260 [Acerihabitans sp. KWT182]|uniref:Uncharacterized protein n=1 Tax=Acerihabitans sp. KWT182 TaxID=3157919 RepID=A0AAU7QDJ9_9GAMM